MENSECRKCNGTGLPDPLSLAVEVCTRCGGSGLSLDRRDLTGAIRLLIIGHGRHGKDTVGDILSDQYGLRSASSSEFCAQVAVYPVMHDFYPDWRTCFEDRANHRELWFHAIAAYSLRPGPMLAHQILVDHDIYTGMRMRTEFERSRDAFDLVVWVDASNRLPPEAAGSMELTKDDAGWIIDNNGPADALPGEVAKLIDGITDDWVLSDAFERHG